MVLGRWKQVDEPKTPAHLSQYRVLRMVLAWVVSFQRVYLVGEHAFVRQLNNQEVLVLVVRVQHNSLMTPAQYLIRFVPKRLAMAILPLLLIDGSGFVSDEHCHLQVIVKYVLGEVYSQSDNYRHYKV